MNAIIVNLVRQEQDNRELRQYILKNYKCIPLKNNQKHPNLTGWSGFIDKQKLNINTKNFGLLCGQLTSNGFIYIIDIDIEQNKLETTKKEDKIKNRDAILKEFRERFNFIKPLFIVSTANFGLHIAILSKKEIKTITEKSGLIANAKIGVFAKGKQTVCVSSTVNGNTYDVMEFNPDAIPTKSKELIKIFNDLKPKIIHLKTSPDKQTATQPNSTGINKTTTPLILKGTGSNELLASIARELCKLNKPDPSNELLVNEMADLFLASDNNSNLSKQPREVLLKRCKDFLKDSNGFLANLYKQSLTKKRINKEWESLQGIANYEIDNIYFSNEQALINKTILENQATALIGVTGTGKTTSTGGIIDILNKKDYSTIYLSWLRINVFNNQTITNCQESSTLKSLWQHHPESFTGKEVCIVLDEIEQLQDCIFYKNSIVSTKEQIKILEFFRGLQRLQKEGFIKDLKFIVLDVVNFKSYATYFKEELGIPLVTIQNNYLPPERPIIEFKNIEIITQKMLSLQSFSVFCGRKRDADRLYRMFTEIKKLENKDNDIILITSDTEKIDIADKPCIIFYTGRIERGYSIKNKYIKDLFIIDNNSKLKATNITHAINRHRTYQENGVNYGIENYHYFNRTHKLPCFEYSRKERDEFIGIEQRASYYRVLNEIEKKNNFLNDNRAFALDSLLKKEGIIKKQINLIENKEQQDLLKECDKIATEIKHKEDIEALLIDDNKIIETEAEYSKGDIDSQRVYDIVKNFGTDQYVLNDVITPYIEKNKSKQYLKRLARASYRFDSDFFTGNYANPQEQLQGDFVKELTGVHSLDNIDYKKKFDVDIMLIEFNRIHLKVEAIFNIKKQFKAIDKKAPTKPELEEEYKLQQMLKVCSNRGLYFKQYSYRDENGKPQRSKKIYVLDKKKINQMINIVSSRNLYDTSVSVASLFVINLIKIRLPQNNFKEEFTKAVDLWHNLATKEIIIEPETILRA